MELLHNPKSFFFLPPKMKGTAEAFTFSAETQSKLSFLKVQLAYHTEEKSLP